MKNIESRSEWLWLVRIYDRTLIPFAVFETPIRRPARSASYKYSFSSSLNKWTNMCVKSQFNGSA